MSAGQRMREEREFEANVSVSPAIDSFLLGSDWLEANEAKSHFASLASSQSLPNRKLSIAGDTDTLASNALPSTTKWEFRVSQDRQSSLVSYPEVILRARQPRVRNQIPRDYASLASTV